MRYISFIRVDHPMNECLKLFVAARNTKTSAALGELALVISRCITDQFSRFLPAAERLWNLLLSGLFSGGPFNSQERCKLVPSEGLPRL